MTSERLGEMFKGDSADTRAGNFPLMSMGGRADPSSVRERKLYLLSLPMLFSICICSRHHSPCLDASRYIDFDLSILLSAYC